MSTYSWIHTTEACDEDLAKLDVFWMFLTTSLESYEVSAPVANILLHALDTAYAESIANNRRTPNPNLFGTFHRILKAISDTPLSVAEIANLRDVIFGKGEIYLPDRDEPCTMTRATYMSHREDVVNDFYDIQDTEEEEDADEEEGEEESKEYE